MCLETTTGTQTKTAKKNANETGQAIRSEVQEQQTLKKHRQTGKVGPCQATLSPD